MRIVQIVLLVLIIVGLGLIFTQKYWVNPLVNFILQQSDKVGVKNDSLNISFAINGQDYALVDGKVEKEIAPGSASKEVVMVFGVPVYGDLNGDGADDAVMFLTQNFGGSGTFFYVLEVLNHNGILKGTNALLLGDRIAPQNINIIKGRAVANFAERKTGEPMTTSPSIGKSVWINYDAKTGEIAESAD